ncbi:hypothetical protein [Brachybacterium sp. YJGR34]|uniref:hypothetical protein n=1 Tax=Brachybacterium sp. YJGR34 TaxID=2059911 RepID=UPI000E0B5875|nr:hypothetical protein [Brachybacterium sp. YJGR34]
MTSPAARRLLHLTAAAGAVGALTLIEPRRLGPGPRAAYRVGTAVVSGALAADTAQDAPLLDPVRDGVVAGGITLGLMDVLERIDARTVDSLAALGVRRPRVLLAALGAAGTAAVCALPRLTGPIERRGGTEEGFAEGETAPLPCEVRALLAALLAPGPADPPGAAALRDQLEAARAVDPGYLDGDVQIHVEDPERLAVPRTQIWPVAGEFSHAGFRYELQLQVEEGRLGMLTVMVRADEARLAQALEHLASPGFVLPDPSALTLRRETEVP